MFRPKWGHFQAANFVESMYILLTSLAFADIDLNLYMNLCLLCHMSNEAKKSLD